MPGPCNLKKKKKQQAKKARKPSSQPISVLPTSVDVLAPTDHLYHFSNDESGGLVPQTPYIHDPGNGPRVRDTRAFLSSFFAQPPSLDNPLCAEFAQQEVCQMLCTVLPEETALILWYNKSRATGRICPACQRLYRLGDVLPDHLKDEDECADEPRPIELSREQQISGLCSPVCFILASFNYPGAIKSTWGRTANEIDDNTWDLLNRPGEGHGAQALALGMLLKMTRLEDLGLGQLCLPDIDFDSGYDSDPSQLHSRECEKERQWARDKSETRRHLARAHAA